ncbi:MAG TPA: aminotransferase class I/II-fold pyridoxal phosphate-dependent enzyme [Candidatus Cybelea sp.]|nr:aminotransferase class I/II-fold pyridoxal phosphate-dependent enzyme [Candidatus Cybelea sp.]
MTPPVRHPGAAGKIAKRAAVDPFIVMDVMRAAGDYARRAAAENLPGVLHLEVGQPSTPAPRLARAAAAAALEAEALGYTESLGVDPLRARIARHYRDRYGLALSPERIAVTTGSSGGFLLAFLAAFDPGDRVALASPGYPCYRHILSVLGIEPVLVEAGEETKFQPTPELLEAKAGRIDGLIVASPSNPVGAMVSPEALADLAQWCDRRGVRLISDEIYHGITYGMQAATAAALSDHAIVVNSFSKYFSMTGWRIGWLVLPPELVRPIERLAQNLYISAPAISQAAGLAAFDATEELDGNVRRYAANRDLLLEELPKAGFDRLTVPDGAFYIYADVSAFTPGGPNGDSLDFSRRMLAETGIAATPGLDFDPARGAHFMRFSFAGSTADMAEAARRLKAWHNKARR